MKVCMSMWGHYSYWDSPEGLWLVEGAVGALTCPYHRLETVLGKWSSLHITLNGQSQNLWTTHTVSLLNPISSWLLFYGAFYYFYTNKLKSAWVHPLSNSGLADTIWRLMQHYKMPFPSKQSKHSKSNFKEYVLDNANSLDMPKTLELVGMAKTVPEASSQFSRTDCEVA